MVGIRAIRGGNIAMLRRIGLALCLGLVLSASLSAAEPLATDATIPEAVDHFVGLQLRAEGIEPAPRADDAVILRRTMLDLVGRPPLAAEAEAYLASEDKDKRTKLVDELLASEGFVRHQVNELDWLMMQGQGSLRDYLKVAVAENRPWDEIFREIITAKPSDEAPGVHEYMRSRISDADRLTNEVSVLFFGVNVSCTQCHDHPEVWTWPQSTFYGMKSFFNRTVEVGSFIGERSFGTVTYQTPAGESHEVGLQFLDGQEIADPTLPPKEMDDAAKKKLKEAEDAEKKAFDEAKKAKQPPPAPEFSRRMQLIDVALNPEGDGPRLMAKSIVNRLWARLHGRGLVEPLDQMHDFNDPSHPELLNWLAEDLIRHDFDLKRLVRGLVLSETYARTSYWAGDRRPEGQLFAVGEIRPLSPRQYGAALRIATQDPMGLPKGADAAELAKRGEQTAQGGEGLQNYFAPVTEGFSVGAGEALVISNNDRVSRELTDNGLTRRLVQVPEDKVVPLAVRTVYGREPEAAEVRLLNDFLAKAGDNRESAIRQLVWALVASPELRFNY